MHEVRTTQTTGPDDRNPRPVRSSTMKDHSRMVALPLPSLVRFLTQGYAGVDDGLLARVHGWLRVAPAISLGWAVAATLVQSPFALSLLAATAGLASVLSRHPFELLHDCVLRRWTGTPRLPEHQAPRRFAWGMTALWLLGTVAAFELGTPALGCLLGGLVSGTLLVAVLTDFCALSYVFSWTARSLERRRPCGGAVLAAADGPHGASPWPGPAA
jgi:hypothetical protein